jgi:hypothetical protein
VIATEIQLPSFMASERDFDSYLKTNVMNVRKTKESVKNEASIAEQPIPSPAQANSLIC